MDGAEANLAGADADLDGGDADLAGANVGVDAEELERGEESHLFSASLLHPAGQPNNFHKCHILF